MAIRIGAGTGGTHTDLAWVDDDTGAITTLKVPTTRTTSAAASPPACWRRRGGPGVSRAR